MNKIYPKEGLYNLKAKDIFAECKILYKEFFSEQTLLRAFRLSITLYHLLEWVLPEGNTKFVKQIETKSQSTNEIISREEKLALDLRKYEFYEVLKSLANSSKHYALSKSEAYEKKTLEGFILGKSVLGEKFGQRNFIVNFEGEDIWIRMVFDSILKKYEEYFNNFDEDEV